MRVFVAGGTGIIGRGLIPLLVAAGHFFTRARHRIEEGRPRFAASRAQGTELVNRFLDAAGGGDLEPFIEMLAPDVVFYGDGGGKGASVTAPIYGRVRVERLMRGLARRARDFVASARPVEVNGQPGLLSFDREGNLVGVLAFDLLDGQVHAIRSMVNPDKLRHLGTPSEAFTRSRRPGGGSLGPKT
jgi:RNA polymerase sigma-70 factor, ECF subfamily